MCGKIFAKMVLCVAVLLACLPHFGQAVGSLNRRGGKQIYGDINGRLVLKGTQLSGGTILVSKSFTAQLEQAQMEKDIAREMKLAREKRQTQQPSGQTRSKTNEVNSRSTANGVRASRPACHVTTSHVKSVQPAPCPAFHCRCEPLDRYKVGREKRKKAKIERRSGRSLVSRIADFFRSSTYKEPTREHTLGERNAHRRNAMASVKNKWNHFKHVLKQSGDWDVPLDSRVHGDVSSASFWV